MKKYRLIKINLVWLLLFCTSRAAQDALEDYKLLTCDIRPLKRLGYDRSLTRPHLPFKEGTSLNWSGYVAATNFNSPAPDTVNKITGNWVVPTVSPTNNNAYCSIWIGIDGSSDNTVEQIGTEHDWSNGSQQNYAWFEMYPNYPFEIIGFPLHVGDNISALIEYVGNSTFKLSLINNTRKVHSVIPYQYTKSKLALRSSAEWIVEAPFSTHVLPLSHFSPVKFSNCSAVICNTNLTLAQAVHKSLTMVTNTNVAKAIPSTLLNGGTSFDVTWHHE